jgi:hypothetical protein
MTAMQEFVVPKSIPNTFAIKNKKSVVRSLLPRNYDAAIPETTWNPLKQRTKLAFGPFLKASKTAPKASHWHSKSANHGTN